MADGEWLAGTYLSKNTHHLSYFTPHQQPAHYFYYQSSAVFSLKKWIWPLPFCGGPPIAAGLGGPAARLSLWSSPQPGKNVSFIRNCPEIQLLTSYGTAEPAQGHRRAANPPQRPPGVPKDC